MDLKLYIIVGGIALVIIILFAWVIWLQNKLGRLLVGKSKTLDESLANLDREIAELKKFRVSAEETFEKTDARLKKAVSGVATVRFNPFKGDGSGGNQSFATAFLNEEKNGVILSSLYGREHMSVYSKPVKNLASDYELTNEEREALSKAENSIKK